LHQRNGRRRRRRSGGRITTVVVASRSGLRSRRADGGKWRRRRQRPRRDERDRRQVIGFAVCETAIAREKRRPGVCFWSGSRELGRRSSAACGSVSGPARKRLVNLACQIRVGPDQSTRAAVATHTRHAKRAVPSRVWTGLNSCRAIGQTDSPHCLDIYRRTCRARGGQRP
jgi:hypothetical protein